MTGDALRALAVVFAGHPLALGDVAETLGTQKTRSAGDVHIAPFDPAFTDITLVRWPGRDEPAHARVTLAHATTVAQLARIFGRPVFVSAEGEILAQALFRLEMPGARRQVTLIAELGEGGAVSCITLRRDR